MVRIPRIRRRVVVVVAHGDDRAFGHKDRLAKMINSLPIRVPVRNADEPLALAAGQRGIALEQLAKIVRMRVNGKYFRVERQAEIVGNQEIRVAGRNVELAVVLKLDQHREPLLWFIREIQADGRLRMFRLARWPQVRIQHQVVAWIQPPRRPSGSM